MKKILVYFILSFGSFLFTTCDTSDEKEELPYYEFNELDEQLIINFKYLPEQVIVYENQFNEQLHFKVISNRTEVEEARVMGTLSGGSPSILHYFDIKVIRIVIIENPINDGAYDKEYSYVHYVFSKGYNEFNNSINLPLWNVAKFASLGGSQNAVNISLTDFNISEKLQMNINGHLFNRVIEIDSGSDETNNNSAFGPLPQNVNKLFYDYDFGIVQFNDVDGKEWKVIYPE